MKFNTVFPESLNTSPHHIIVFLRLKFKENVVNNIYKTDAYTYDMKLNCIPVRLPIPVNSNEVLTVSITILTQSKLITNVLMNSYY